MKKSLIILFALSALASATQTTENFAFSSPSSSVAFKNVFDLSKDWEMTVDLDISPYYQYFHAGKLTDVSILSSNNGALELNSKVVYNSTEKQAWLVMNGSADIPADETPTGIYSYWSVGTFVESPSDYNGCNLTISYKDNLITITATTDNGGKVFEHTTYTFNNISFAAGTVLSSLTTGITQELLSSECWYLPTGTFTGTIIPLAPEAGSSNGAGGQGMLNDIIINTTPQPDGDLSKLVNSINAGLMTDETMSAVAGASVVVPGQALNRDVERQLDSMRNRVAFGYAGSDTITFQSTEGKGASVSTEASKPDRFRVWVNAEGNRAEQDADSTAAGYTLSSWGATLGAGMQVNDKLTVGLALTSMFGDLKSDGPDYLDGDMDTSYVSAFAGYNSGKWSHALIGTIGVMEADMNRRVNLATGSYSTYGETDGLGMGLMYEVSRAFALKNGSSISPVFNISYRHTEVDAYTESNSDAGLDVGEQSLDTVTLGAGARYNATVGEQTLNRACSLQARALAKYDLGDRSSETTVGFIGRDIRANIESAEIGAFGVELGAGVSVPVGRGSIFADGEVELRSDYTNFNATVGYQLTF
ncbi:MAG: autotransporter outer membrane beta-barrel domain-containing protein [Akkermansia sp.]|nr:autotransporter outer membrane beta-barrel domain-containing protein [Akkermansia sp.]